VNGSETEAPTGDRGRDEASSAWRFDPQVVAERIGGRIVVVHLETNKIYELNATAARAFELMRQGADRAALERALLDEYAVEPARVAESVDRLLAELAAAGIVR
jgi:hypothetical protein